MSGYDLVIERWDTQRTPPLSDDIQFRSLTHVRIDPEHPLLYNSDGIVFRRETDELIAVMLGGLGHMRRSGTKSIGEIVFQNCDMLESISIPRSVTTVKERAFPRRAALRTVQFPPMLHEIGQHAFLNCIFLAAIVLLVGRCFGEHAFEYRTEFRAVYAWGLIP